MEIMKCCRYIFPYAVFFLLFQVDFSDFSFNWEPFRFHNHNLRRSDFFFLVFWEIHYPIDRFGRKSRELKALVDAHIIMAFLSTILGRCFQKSCFDCQIQDPFNLSPKSQPENFFKKSPKNTFWTPCQFEKFYFFR